MSVAKQERLGGDCATVFSARAAGNGEHSSGSTHWLDLNDTPRCLLEQLAGAILRAHLPPNVGSEGAKRGESRVVGAEWWALAIDAEDATVGFHWDLDYEAEERLHVHRTPYAATVTYLCDVVRENKAPCFQPSLRWSGVCLDKSAVPVASVKTTNAPVFSHYISE